MDTWVPTTIGQTISGEVRVEKKKGPYGPYYVLRFDNGTEFKLSKYLEKGLLEFKQIRSGDWVELTFKGRAVSAQGNQYDQIEYEAWRQL